MNLRRFFSFLCCLSLLVLSAPSSVLASTGSRATPGNAFESSGIQDAIDSLDPVLPDMMYDQIITPFSSTDVDLGIVTWYSDVYDKNTRKFIKTLAGNTSVGSTYHSVKFPTLPSNQFYDNAYFHMSKNKLPPSGKYGFTTRLQQGNVSISCSAIYFRVTSSVPNVGNKNNQIALNLTGVSSGTGNLMVDYRTSNVSVVYNIDSSSQGNALDFVYKPSEVAVFTFQQQSGDTLVPPSSENGSSSGADQVTDAISSLGDMFEGLIDGIISAITSIGDKISGAVDNASNAITGNADQNSQNEIGAMEENTNIITDALSSLGNFIIDGLKGLFIPSDDFFKSWFDDMYAFFETRLGFLMVPLDFLLRLLDIFTGGASFTGIPFPEFKWIDGTVIIPAQTVTFTFLETEWGKEIQEMLYFVGNVILTGALLSLMHRKLEEVLKG